MWIRLPLSCSYQPSLQTSPRTCWRPRLWPDKAEMSWLNANPGCLLAVSFLGGRGRKPWERATGTWFVYVEQLARCNDHCSLFNLLYSQNIAPLTYFNFLWLLLMVTSCKEQNRSVTQYHLNCIITSGCAQSKFLRCLLEIIGRS